MTSLACPDCWADPDVRHDDPVKNLAHPGQAIRSLTTGAREIRITVNGLPLSGLVTEVPEPRALLVALHGGGMTAGYFHGEAHPSLSLLSLGASLGFSVLALDRPGYGASTDVVPDGLPLDGQVEAVLGAIAAFGEAHHTGAGCVLVGHSAGAMVSLAIAGRGTTPIPLLGVDFSGIGLAYSPALSQDGQRLGGAMSSAARRFLNWGPSELFPPGTFEPGVRPGAPTSSGDGEFAGKWPDIAADVLRKVRVPVRWTTADQEGWWATGPQEEEKSRALLAAAPSIQFHRQPFANHNVSLGWSARSYHLCVIAFAEQCLLPAGTQIS